MTAWGSVEGAVEAMRRGARDYIQKPWDNQRLLQTLRTQIELGQALRRSRRLESETSRLRSQRAARAGGRVAGHAAGAAADGAGGAVRRQRADHRRARHRQGGGGALAARRLRSAPARPFVAVNAGGVSEGVFESELFGHVQGRLHRRHDRPGRLLRAGRGGHAVPRRDRQHAADPAGQAAARAADRRVPPGRARRGSAGPTCACWRPPTSTWARRWPPGRFREDLLYRLNTVEMHLPPLRERREDIPPLADHFAGRLAARYGQAAPGFSPAAMQALLEHAWPGNVRELEHVVERALLLAQGPAGRARGPGAAARARAATAATRRSEQMTLEEVERHLIQRALARSRRPGQRRRPGAGAVAQRALPAAAAPRAQRQRMSAALAHQPRGAGARCWRCCRRCRRWRWRLALLWTGGYTRRRCAGPLALVVVVPWLGGRLRAARAGGARAADHRQPAGGPARGRLLDPRRPGAAQPRDALGEALAEVNSLADTLARQRTGAVEASALLAKVMAEIDVAVFAFDGQRRLRLVNRAGERLLGQPGAIAGRCRAGVAAAGGQRRGPGPGRAAGGRGPAHGARPRFARRAAGSGSCGAAPSAWAGCRTSWWC